MRCMDMHRSLLVASLAAALALPASAGASTVSAVPEPGTSFFTTTFTAASGPASNATLTGTTWTDAGQTLTAGANCASAAGAVTCPAGNAIVELAGGADRFTNSFYAFDLTVRGRGGDDTITANGNATRVSGGAGEDTLDLRANGGPTGDGDGGDDALRGGYPTNFAAVLNGGADDDLVVGGSHRDTLTGGGGEDQIFTVWGEDGTASGGKGNDVIVNLTASTRLPGFFTAKGDGGSDTIVGGRYDDAVEAGPGDDLVDVSGDEGVDTVSCGTGDDTVYADAGDTIAADCEDVLAGPAPDLPEVDEAVAHLKAAFPGTNTGGR